MMDHNSLGQEMSQNMMGQGMSHNMRGNEMRLNMRDMHRQNQAFGPNQYFKKDDMGNYVYTHCSLLKNRGLFWWKWLLGQSVAALSFKSYWRAMEQSGADKNGMGGIPTSLGARNTIPNCRQMRLDMTIPNSLI